MFYALIFHSPTDPKKGVFVLARTKEIADRVKIILTDKRIKEELELLKSKAIPKCSPRGNKF